MNKSWYMVYDLGNRNPANSNAAEDLNHEFQFSKDPFRGSKISLAYILGYKWEHKGLEIGIDQIYLIQLNHTWTTIQKSVIM